MSDILRKFVNILLINSVEFANEFKMNSLMNFNEMVNEFKSIC